MALSFQICRGSRDLVFANLLSATLLVALPSPLAARNTPQACWAPAAFPAKDGESQIRKGVPQAFVPPPNGVPIQFTPVLREQYGTVRRVKLQPGQKLIALTFDLCEQPYEIAGYQGEIVDYLRQHQVKATFFAGGKWMLTHRDRAQQLMSDPLFEVGNHTWEHRNLRLLTGSALVDEIERAQFAYEEVRGELKDKQCIGRDNTMLAHEHAPERPALFRFPFGACNAKSLAAVAEAGLIGVQWDVSSGDPWFGQRSEQMIRAVLSEAHPGSIVLFHANGRGWHTGAALPSIIAGLRAEGYQFVTVSELLKAGEPVFTATCYDSKPGDTDRYDALARRLENLYQQTKVLAVSPRTAVGEGIPQHPRREELQAPQLVAPTTDRSNPDQRLPLPRPHPTPQP